MLTKRANILFEEELWDRLVFLAEEKKTSVGELVRTAVKKEYTNQARTKQIAKVVDNILKFREKYGKELIQDEDSTATIRKMREERYGKAHLRRLRSY